MFARFVRFIRALRDYILSYSVYFYRIWDKVKVLLRYIFSKKFVFERKLYWLISFVFLYNEVFRVFICSWIKRQCMTMTFWEFIGWSLFLFIYCFLRHRSKSIKKNVQTTLIIESYLLFNSIKNKLISKKLAAIFYINFTKAWDFVSSEFKSNAYFFNKNLFNKLNHTVNSSNYTKLNKNYRRYSDIIKRYR